MDCRSGCPYGQRTALPFDLSQCGIRHSLPSASDADPLRRLHSVERLLPRQSRRHRPIAESTKAHRPVRKNLHAHFCPSRCLTDLRPCVSRGRHGIRILTMTRRKLNLIHFFVIFLAKKLYYQGISYLCSTRTRQASQRCSNVRVVFVFIGIWQQKFRS